MFQVLGLQFWSISIRPHLNTKNNQIVEKKSVNLAISKITNLYKIKFSKSSQASQELNVESYVIGGFVRDLLLKRFQKDILLPLAAESMALHVSKLLPNKPKFKF
jgi:hypothetical protein